MEDREIITLFCQRNEMTIADGYKKALYVEDPARQSECADQTGYFLTSTAPIYIMNASLLGMGYRRATYGSTYVSGSDTISEENFMKLYRKENNYILYSIEGTDIGEAQMRMMLGVK